MAFKLNHLPTRAEKPRAKGVTLVLDKGFSVRQAEDFCESASIYTDIVKLGWGTSYVTQNLEDKLAVYANAGIPVYLGGTLFEAYVLRDQLDDYLELVDTVGRAVHPSKRGYIPEHTPAILVRLSETIGHTL